MEPLVSRIVNWLGSGHELETQNVIAALLCVALYGLFVSRKRTEPKSWRGGRHHRNPDSVLRGN